MGNPVNTPIYIVVMVLFHLENFFFMTIAAAAAVNTAMRAMMTITDVFEFFVCLLGGCGAEVVSDVSCGTVVSVVSDISCDVCPSVSGAEVSSTVVTGSM